jgi:hypothetical protein
MLLLPLALHFAVFINNMRDGADLCSLDVTISGDWRWSLLASTGEEPSEACGIAPQEAEGRRERARKT